MEDQSKISTFKQLYLDSDFVAARDWLIKNKYDFDLDVYHYNLGTVHFKMESFAKARYNFELAKNYGLYSSALLKNLDASKAKLRVKQFEKNESFIDVWYNTGVSASADLIWSFLFVVIIAALVAKYFKKITKYVAILLILIATVPIGLKYFYFNSYNYVFPLDLQRVYEGPSKIFSQSNSPPIGSKLIIRDHNEEWVEIVSPSKSAGWIEKKLFKSLHLR